MAQLGIRLSLSLVLIAALVAPAAAQDDPKFALVASFPTPTVSFQWQAHEQFALRFEGSYSFRDESSEYVSGGASIGGRTISPTSRMKTETTSHNSSIGVTGVLTLHRSGRTQLYLAPRVFVSFTRQSLSEEQASLPEFIEFLSSNGVFNQVTWRSPDAPAGPTTQSVSYASPGAGLSFGVSSAVFERIALFGEAGFSYGRSNSPNSIGSTLSTIATATTKRTTASTRAVAGVMFLF